MTDENTEIRLATDIINHQSEMIDELIAINKDVIKTMKIRYYIGILTGFLSAVFIYFMIIMV